MWSTGRCSRIDILVDDHVVATQKLERDQPGEFFSIQYGIAPSLTAGKTEVTVKFQAHPDCMAGGVFGLSMLRPAVEKR